MRRIKSWVMILITLTLLMGLTGCVAGYDEAGPEWDGNIFFPGGNDRDYHRDAFHAADGRHPVNMGSSRGRASMGAHASGGGHAASGGHRK